MAMRTIRARSHRRLTNCRRYRRPPWTWPLLTARRRPTRQQTITPSTPMMNPGEYIFCHQLQPRRCRTERWKWNWARECPFQKKGECRSTSAMAAVRRSPQQRTSQVHQTRIRTLKTLKLIYELLNLWFHSTHHVFINFIFRTRSRY